jgi:hypothetical protein
MVWVVHQIRIVRRRQPCRIVTVAVKVDFVFAATAADKTRTRRTGLWLISDRIVSGLDRP